MAMKLYVGNLSFKTSSDDLRELFSQAGTVDSASVVENRETGRS
jgi:cold-inducible RNA-binding protein